MRKSFNTLAALVLEMGQDVVAGDAFLFVGKRRRRAKVLWFDGTGYVPPGEAARAGQIRRGVGTGQS